MSNKYGPSPNEIEKKETIAEKKIFRIDEQQMEEHFNFFVPWVKKKSLEKNLGCVSGRKQSLVGKMSAERNAEP